jgi:hypothetical protein
LELFGCLLTGRNVKRHHKKLAASGVILKKGETLAELK